MKIQICNWTPSVITAGLAVVMCVQNATAQQSPGIAPLISEHVSYNPAATDSPYLGEPKDFSGTAAPASDYFEEYDRSVASSPVTRNWVLGVNALILERDLDGNRLFSFNPADSTQTLSSRDADPGDTGGVDVTLATRTSTGMGFEARYWGLYPSSTTGILQGNPATAINGLSQIDDGGVALSDSFNTSDFHSLTRNYSFNNVELNLLRNARSYTPFGRNMTFERLYGFRYMQFNESLEYAGVSASNPIIRSALNSSVENSMFGFQTGGRGEWQLYNRISFAFAGKLGVFNNRARTGIVATNQDSSLAFSRPLITDGPNAGAEFEFGDTRDDLTVMGELDLGLIYQMSRRSRLRVGYRLLGVSDIADAARNIPANFNDTSVLSSANTDGDLVFKGGYAGVEIAF